MPSDNPVYEPGSVININELKGTGSSPQTTTAPDQQEFEGLESSVEKRRFDNPTYYGDNDINETDDHDDIDDVYTQLLLISKINDLYQIMSLITQFMELKHTITKFTIIMSDPQCLNYWHIFLISYMHACLVITINFNSHI